MKTLVVLPNWIGDAVIAQSLIEILQRQGAQIDVLAHPPVADLAHFFPHVNHVLVPPFSRKGLQIRARWSYARQFLQDYERAIILPNSFKSALLPFFAGIPIRIGYVGEQRYGVITVRHHDSAMTTSDRFAKALPRRAMAEFYAALAFTPQKKQTQKCLPQSSSQIPLPRLLHSTDQVSPISFESYGVFCPGAEFGPAKRWPTEYWAKLAQELLMSDKNAVAGIVICGSVKDRATSEELIAALPSSLQARVLNTCGQTSIGQVLSVIVNSQWVLANDSGLMHCAAALAKPVLGIYGPTDFWHTPPRGERAHYISESVACAPCQLRHCPLQGDAHHRCMRELTVQKILQHDIFKAKHSSIERAY